MQITSQSSRSRIILYLILIIIISLGLKLYTVDFFIPPHTDDVSYITTAIEYSQGDFFLSQKKHPGWPLVLAPFMSIVNSDNLLDYASTARILSIAISTITIIPMYILARRFFDEKYSLVASCLFAFEPHLNYNSTLGLSEPILILAIIGAFYFILNQNTRFVIISLIMAGIVYWIRINGFWVFVVISIIYFLTQKKSRKFLANYGIAIAVFLLVISPVLIERNEEFGDPFYSVHNDVIFAGSYELMLKAQVDNEKISAFDYIENYGILSFVNNYILIGIYNTLVVTARLTLPYLFILIPFGILFSFRAFDQKSNFIKANWIFILSSMGLVIVIMAIIPEPRFVLYLLPFLIIFSVIPIQRVVEYGLDTFSFSRKQKDFFLIGVLITIIIVSSILIIRYAPDSELEAEKLEFSKYALNNLHGVTLQDREGSLDYVGYLLLVESTGNYKINSSIIQNTYKQFEDTNGPIGTNIEELIADGKNYNLKYIISNETPGFLHPFTDALYYNYEQYPYLKKIFDSSNQGFEKLKIKVFEIDYEKFNKLLNE